MLTPATDADLPEAVALINASYRGESARQGWANESDYIGGERITLAGLRADIAGNPRGGLFIHRDGPENTLLGCVWLEPYKDAVWYLGLLTVRPDLQARQLGRRILAAAEGLVEGQGGQTVRMTVVHLRDTLIGWYARRGYDPTGETLPFPEGHEVLTPLHFVVLEKRLAPPAPI